MSHLTDSGGGGGSGTVTSITFSAPLTGGTISVSGTVGLDINVDHAFTAAQSVTRAGIAATSTDGLILTNSTASTAGVPVQMSPRQRWLTHVWNTAADITHEYWAEVLPTSAVTPTSLWKLQFSNNGGAASTIISAANNGVVTMLALSLTNQLSLSAAISSTISHVFNANSIGGWSISNGNSGAAAGWDFSFGNNVSNTIGKILIPSGGNSTSGLAVASSFQIYTGGAYSLILGTNTVARLTVTSLGSIVVGTAALATNATDGFLYIPTCAGAPTGVPTTQTGTVAMIYDTTNNKFYIYNAAWKGGTVPGAFV